MKLFDEICMDVIKRGEVPIEDYDRLSSYLEKVQDIAIVDYQEELLKEYLERKIREHESK